MRYQTSYRRDYQKFESDQDGGQPHHDKWEIHPFARERFDEIKKGVSKVEGRGNIIPFILGNPSVCLLLKFF